MCFTALNNGNVPPFVPTTVIRYSKGCRPFLAWEGVVEVGVNETGEWRERLREQGVVGCFEQGGLVVLSGA